MALSARLPTTLDTNKFVPEIWSKLVEEAAKSNLVAFDAINGQFRGDLVKGDTLYIPKTNTVTATEVVVGTKGATLNPFNTAAATLVIDQWWEAPVDIDDMSNFQSQVELEDYAAGEAAYAVNKKIDSTVCALFSALNGGTVKGTDGSALTDDVLIEIAEILNEADVPDKERSLIVDPSGLADMLKIDKLLTADYISKKGAIENGIIGHSIYGCLVRVTNNLTAVAAGTGNYGVMLQKRAIGGAIQIQKPWVKRFEELHNTRFQAEALWGVVEVRDDFGVPFYTRKA